MQIRSIGIGFAAAVVFTLGAGAFRAGSPGTPVRSRIVRLEPDIGRPGDIIAASGEQLDRSRVEDLFLTNEECTALVTIIQQTEALIRFRIPAKLPRGRYTVVTKPVGRYRLSVDQKVTLTVI